MFDSVGSVETEKQEKPLYDRAEKLFKEYLQDFLAGGQIEGFDQFSEAVALNKEDAKNFLNFIDAKKFLDFIEAKHIYPYLCREADPRESSFKEPFRNKFTIAYFAQNTIYIWNLDHCEYE